MPKTVAIHQPNFFPWLGYFDKIARANVFVFLDDVQFPKTGGVWSNRNKLLIGGEARWVTAAIDRQYHGKRQINEMLYLQDNPWRLKVLKTLENEYRRHPFYSDVIVVIEPLLINPKSNVAEYNIHAVATIARALNLDTSKLRRSSACTTTGASNELLCNLTRSVGGDTYICGGGADGYQDDAYFKQQGVSLEYQNFQHPIYPQRGQATFVPGLSVIDVAMNVGWQGVREMLMASDA